MATVDTGIPFRAFPALKQEMTQAAETGRFAADVRGTVDNGIKVSRQSPGAAFANAPAEKEFQTILQARDPRAAARQAARDKTGQATRDLKAAALDHLIGKASRDGGLSGKSIREALNDLRTGGALAYRRPPKLKAQMAPKDRAA